MCIFSDFLYSPLATSQSFATLCLLDTKNVLAFHLPWLGYRCFNLYMALISYFIYFCTPQSRMLCLDGPLPLVLTSLRGMAECWWRNRSFTLLSGEEDALNSASQRRQSQLIWFSEFPTANSWARRINYIFYIFALSSYRPMAGAETRRV